MMGWYGGGGMGSFGLIGFLMWIFVLIDLILLAVWLWKQIQK